MTRLAHRLRIVAMAAFATTLLVPLGASAQSDAGATPAPAAQTAPAPTAPAATPAPSANGAPDAITFSSEVKRLATRLQDLPEFKSRIDGLVAGITDPNKKKQKEIQVTSDLTRKGLVRLDPESLRSRLRLWGKVYSSLQGSCSGLLRGTATTEQVESMFQNALSPTDLQTWFDIQYKAAVAELHQTPIQQPDAEPLKMALLSLFAALPNDDGDRLEKILASTGGLAKLNAVPESDVCWAIRTVTTTIPTMKDDESRLLARAFAM